MMLAIIIIGASVVFSVLGLVRTWIFDNRLVDAIAGHKALPGNDARGAARDAARLAYLWTLLATWLVELGLWILFEALHRPDLLGTPKMLLGYLSMMVTGLVAFRLTLAAKRESAHRRIEIVEWLLALSSGLVLYLFLSSGSIKEHEQRPAVTHSSSVPAGSQPDSTAQGRR